MPFPAFFLLAAALGGREAVRSKRRENKVIDAEAERQDTINNIDIGIDAIEAGNRFDASQIEAMQRQNQTALGMLRSKDPELRKLGANMIADLDSAVRGNIQQNETEARTDAVRQQDLEIASAGIGKADNERRFDRTLVMNKQLNDELKGYGNAQVSYDKVLNLLDNDDQLSSLAGLTAFVQAIDNSVVREGELIKYQGANGFITQIVNLVNKSEGRDFDAVTKQSIRNAAAALMNSEKAKATAITNSYQGRAAGFGLDPEKVLSGVDQTLFTPLQIDRSAQVEAERQADLAEAAQEQFVGFNEANKGPVSQSFEAVGLQPPSLGTAISVVADKALQTWQDAGRALRGATLHIDPQSGEIWEKDAQGKWRKITGTPDQQRQAEILRLQNTGVQLSPDVQRRADEQQQRADDRAERRREDRREPGLFQEGGFFDRRKEQ